MMVSGEPLIGHTTPDARVAVRTGVEIAAGQFVGDAQVLAAQLPPARYILNACADRYWFAVAFAAALIGGRRTLLPPSRSPEAVTRLLQAFPDSLCIDDRDGFGWRHAATAASHPIRSGAVSWPAPMIMRETIAAIAFTSGSTGEPQPQLKAWGKLVDGARAEVESLDWSAATLAERVLIGTVAPQHMFGFESTVMLALHGPCAFATEHPLHPDEVAAALENVDARRVLITTPLHLRALVESPQSMPPLDCVVSATAPLSASLAEQCEREWSTRVMEVYGCTETGMIATRRTVEGERWTTMRDVTLKEVDGRMIAQGGHVHTAPLADCLQLDGPTRFELKGRADDMVNIGGKRASLEGLNRTLRSLDGVIDGVLFFPREEGAAVRERRLMAMVVAPGMTREQVLAALRAQIDAAFLPRPLLLVDELPRNAQGKLPRAELLALAERAQAAAVSSQPRASRAVANR